MFGRYSGKEVMLTLAAITYRGWELTAPDNQKGERMRLAVEDCLENLDPVRGMWRIAWGPATFTPLCIGFADTAVYVVRYTKCDRTPTLVIAVRGTNPLCALDWLLGDFIVNEQVAWKYGKDTNGRISWSTAFGLEILQHLRSETHCNDKTKTNSRPENGTLDTLLDWLSKWEVIFRGASRELPAEHIDSISNVLRELPTLTSDRKHLQDVREKFNNRWQKPQSFLGDMVKDIKERQKPFGSGCCLRSFLDNEVTQKETDIYVTGHSKGGTLATTLALWLTDTQARRNPKPEWEWDRNSKATIHAYSFAAPSAGNEDFATYSNAVLGSRCQRIVNVRDVAPYAWADLDRIPEQLNLASRPERERNLVQAAVEPVKKRVQPRDYKQIERTIELPEPSKALSRPLFEEIVHQHLDGYFERLNLSLCAEDFFIKHFEG